MEFFSRYFQLGGETPAIQPETLFVVAGLPITNAFLMSLVVTFTLAALALSVRAFRVRPGKWQSFVEILYEAMLDLVEQIVGDRARAKQIFPLIATLFVFIGVSNLITLLPVITSFTYDGTPLFRSPTSDFNLTFGLALGMVLLINLISIKEWGLLNYLSRFVQIRQVVAGFRQGVGAGFQAIIEFMVGLLDIVSEVAKVISLSLRLFGNLYAGEVLMVIIFGALAYAFPALYGSMSVLTGVVQAIVFGSLAAAYYATALPEPKKESDALASEGTSRENSARQNSSES